MNMNYFVNKVKYVYLSKADGCKSHSMTAKMKAIILMLKV